MVASGSVAVYLLGRDILKSEYGAVTFSILYLLYPGGWGHYFLRVSHDHPGYRFLAVGNLSAPSPTVVGRGDFSLLAAACKENVPLLLVTFGAYLWLVKQGRRSVGAALALTGVVWFLGAVFWLQPRFSPHWRKHPDAKLCLDGRLGG